MAKITKEATALAEGVNLPCVDCVDTGTEVWVSHNNGTDWYEIPMVYQVQKQATRTNAQTIRFNGQSVNVCTAASKTWTFIVGIWLCLALHYRSFVIDGDQVWIRVVFGDTLDVDPEEVVNAEFDDDGYTRNDQNTTPTQVGLRFEASEILFNNFAEIAGAPREAAVNNDPADFVAAGVTL